MRRLVSVYSWVSVFLLVALLLAPVVRHPSWYLAHPRDGAWVALALAIAMALACANPWFSLRAAKWPAIAGMGLTATFVGFTIQSVINGPLAAGWGKPLVWQEHLLFGPVAAFAQTFGKWIALLVISGINPPKDRRGVIQNGLTVGLGFTVWEISFLYFQIAWMQVPAGLLGLLERASASVFHIYSGGLIAIAVASGRAWPVLLVLVIHACSDFLAGAGGALGLSINLLEAVFTVFALVVWGACIAAGKSMPLSVPAAPINNQELSNPEG